VTMRTMLAKSLISVMAEHADQTSRLASQDANTARRSGRESPAPPTRISQSHRTDGSLERP
jgi:hypothetical protein